MTTDARGTSPVAPHRYRLAYLALLWEAGWPALWPALAIVGGFLVIALLDLLPELNPWAHGAVLAGFAIALVAALVGGLGAARWPNLAGARRRLETANALQHRPLAALEDKP
ncbi:MAG: DUF4175 family protein, partial [Alphaproteobacteria bacterium]|nr:DUF4175 family protein [Alphaproteobacteria bacterium]